MGDMPHFYGEGIAYSGDSNSFGKMFHFLIRYRKVSRLIPRIAAARDLLPLVLRRAFTKRAFSVSSIDNDFSGLRVHYLDFSWASAGSYEFRFWANSTSSLLTDYDSITIVWINPTPPSLSVVANITDPFVNDWTELTVTCQSGSGNVSSLWYYSPMDNTNQRSRRTSQARQCIP